MRPLSHLLPRRLLRCPSPLLPRHLSLHLPCRVPRVLPRFLPRPRQLPSCVVLRQGYLLWPVLLISLLLNAGLARAEGVWAGTWQIQWRENGGRVILEQEGNRVQGRFPLFEGTIQAEIRKDAQGDRLEGHWAGGDREGHFVAVLSRDGQAFSGRFDTGEWLTGSRTLKPEVLQQPVLTSPRAAFTSFVVAANLADSGIDDAWGIAADTIDFSLPLPRTEQLARVRNLFRLVDLTTFKHWSIPDPAPGSERFELRLEQQPSGVILPLTLRRDAQQRWRLLYPGDENLQAARSALLAAYGGHPPPSDAYRQLRTPRDTMRAFLIGMADWRGPGHDLALSTLDLSALPELLRQPNGDISAQYLRRILDHIGLVGLQSIPNDGTSRAPYVHFVQGNHAIVIAPSGPKPEDPWQFTTQTIKDIRDLYLLTEHLPPPIAAPPGLIPESTFFKLRGRVGEWAPALLGRVRQTEYWQVLGGLLALSGALLIARAIAALLCAGLRRLPGAGELPAHFRWSVIVICTLTLMYPVPVVLGLAEGVREYTLPFWGVIGCIAAGLVGWQLLAILGDFLTALAERTTRAADDILVTLLLGGLRLAVVAASALGIAIFLSIPTSNMLAGLGIGGLALAFASRETLSNVFGAGILVTDRPFRRGDWIKTSDIEGAVESVGVRSTRVRTAQDSVVFIPNGKLVDSTINNLGTRRYRLLKQQFLVTAGGTPERLQAFITAIRDRILGDTVFAGEQTSVGLAGIGAGGISVDVTTYLDVTTDAAETQALNTLLLDIMALASQAGLTLGSGMRREVTG